MKNTLVIIAAAALAGCATTKEPAYDTLIAHRGESVDAPENTLPAFKTAVERGFGFECDVYMSRDGKLFTFHDNNLKRTTGGACTERCTEASWAETVSKVNVAGWGKWKGSKFDPTMPALLEDVLALARPGRKIYVEVKGDDDAVGWIPTIKSVFDKEPRATPDTVVLISFSVKTCAEIKRLMPEYKVYLLTNCRRGWEPGAAPVPLAETLENLKNSKADGLDMRFDPELHDQAYVDAVNAAGFEFHVATVDDLPTAKLAFKLGSQTLTTNCAKKLLEEYEKEKKND
ncbi:MAG: hypothetical protein J6T01_03555 [Kiritimatiellae bacterium]|nr:hypothetical protein [Kiritimatiellia bacterium]